MRPVWNKDICINCVACVGMCPVKAIFMRETGLQIDKDLCTSCGTCIRICPVGALEEGGQ